MVGGGDIAWRKTNMLLKAQARVRVIAPALCAELAEALSQQRIEYINRHFEDDDINACTLVISATDDKKVNARVASVAEAHNIPVNVVDQPALCRFIVPSIVDRSPIVIAVSSGGASPVLARLLRARIEAFVPAAYGRLAELAMTYRDKIKQRFNSTDERRRFWDNVLTGRVTELMLAGKSTEAREALDRQLELTAGQKTRAQGEVYLVGAGPGDPDLLSFRALRLMQQADVVLYDRLVAKEILELVRKDAEHVYVGKARAKHTMRQEEINSLLVKLAKQGKRVLRLKGGDPFIFGRGGEEIDTLAEEGIAFQIVPGITAASGCAAYAGIPLTHRDHAQSCVFVTGHLRDGSMNLNWDSLIQPQQTVVCYMGLVGLSTFCASLIKNGAKPDTPIALIEQGTTRNQRVLVSTLEKMPQDAQTQAIRAPTLIIVGNVVTLRDKLKWFNPHDDAASLTSF